MFYAIRADKYRLIAIKSFTRIPSSLIQITYYTSSYSSPLPIVPSPPPPSSLTTIIILTIFLFSYVR